MKYIKHFCTIMRHKYYVLIQCIACGITWRGIVHDLSKFLPAEFFSSARYFQGDKSPIEAEKAALGYSKAWLHHKGHNKHHWEYWIDFNGNGDVVANKIPYVYVVEMICDWIGAGIVYGGKNFNQHEPLDYYNKVRQGRHFHPDTENLIINMLYTLAFRGFKSFHLMTRCEHEWIDLRKNYEKGEYGMECRNIDDLARLLSNRDNISLIDAYNLIDECVCELQEAQTIEEVEDIMANQLLLEMDYYDLLLELMY